MKWLTFAHQGASEDRVGVVEDGVVYELDTDRSLAELVEDPDDLRSAGAHARRAPVRTAAWDEVALRAPLRPPSIRDSLCFLDHLRNALGADEIDPRYRQFPAFYFTNPAALLGPRDDVPLTYGTEKFDYELEVAAVIGRPGSSIAPARAHEHIVGYTVYCDWSARDIQMNEMPLMLGPAKGKDGANSIGPVLVTADEIEERRSGKGFDLAMTAHVNGEPVSSGNWSQIDWGFDDVVAYASRGTHLRAGDVIGSGTVPSGCLIEQSVTDPDGFRGWLKSGDRVTLAVEGIGSLEHRITDAVPVPPLSSGY
jgi:2-keto-4-pentenoate hydratase/2-oxohepta-3-ene-1,7-dioic acid hydratase in catechol pathway